MTRESIFDMILTKRTGNIIHRIIVYTLVQVFSPVSAGTAYIFREFNN